MPLTRRPLRVWQLALAALAGNLLAHGLPALPGLPWLLLCMLMAGLALLRAGASRSALPACIVIAACWTMISAHRGLASRWPAAADGADVRLSGWIDATPTRESGRTVLSLRVTDSAREPVPRRVRLSWYDPAPPLAVGQGLTVTARLRSPRGLLNPGGFDYERWLLLESYDATGYVRQGRLDEGVSSGFTGAWLGLRDGLAQGLRRAIPDPDAAALITALSIGDRSGFAAHHWDVLQRTGTSHLVAVSGLHIGLIAAMAFGLLRRVLLRLPYAFARHAHTLAAGCCIVPAAAYAALAGFGLPTRRALVMVLVAQLLIIGRRRWPLTTGLSIALLAVLAIEPLASLSASFWLSFGAVALLCGAAPQRPPDGRGLIRFRSYCQAYGSLQWTLMLGLTPAVAVFFGLFSPVSVFVNLLAIPVFSLLLVPLSLLNCGLVLVQASATGVSSLSGMAMTAAWRALELAADWPFSAFEVPAPGAAALLLALLAVVAGLPRHGLPGSRLASLALLPVLLGCRNSPEPGAVRMTVLDVGHGLAVIVETRGHRMLYDAGPVYQSGFDTGAEIVWPALRALGAQALDRLMLSHGDSDHAGGAPGLIARMPGLDVLAGPDVLLPNVRRCEDGQTWVWDEVVFEVLHPPPGFTELGNESSCVLRIAGAGSTILLTGDIERRAEARLAADPRLAADVVIVPHHGSLTSSSAAFVRAVSPQLAVVSAGHNNRWDFPRPEVRARWESLADTFVVTGDSGAIRILLENGRIVFDSQRNRWQTWWQAERDRVSGAIDATAL